MRKLTVMVFLSLLIGKLSAQQLSYSKVEEVPGKSAKILYNCAKMWFAATYKNAGNVIQMDTYDEGQGIIMGKAVMKYSSSIFQIAAQTEGYIYYDIKVETKDGKFRYEINQFIHRAELARSPIDFGLITLDEVHPHYRNQFKMNSFYEKGWNDMKSEIDIYVKNLTTTLSQGMYSSACRTQSDW